MAGRRSQFHVPPGREVRVGRAAVRAPHRAPHRWVGRTRKFSIVGSEEGEDEESVAQGLDETPQKQCCNDTKAHDETSSGGHFHFHWFDYLESRVVLVNYCSK